MSGMAAFMVAIGGASLICYLLMIRTQNRSTRRESAGDGAYSGSGGSDSFSSGGWNLFSWGNESSSSHDSASSSDSGGGDGGGGGGGD